MVRKQNLVDLFRLAQKRARSFLPKLFRVGTSTSAPARFFTARATLTHKQASLSLCLQTVAVKYPFVNVERAQSQTSTINIPRAFSLFVASLRPGV